MEMVALKRVKYPHGPTGREYQPGEVLTALSERDAKALYVSGRAVAKEKASPKSRAELPAKAMAAVREVPKPSGRSRGRYNRRDMTAEDGQTGAESAPSSSPPAPQPEEPISEPGADESAS